MYVVCVEGWCVRRLVYVRGLVCVRAGVWCVYFVDVMGVSCSGVLCGCDSVSCSGVLCGCGRS